MGIPQILNFCEYFGRPSIHPTGPTPKGIPTIHIAHSGGGDLRLAQGATSRTNSMNWHIDGSVDPQPPGLVFLYMLECPDVGGDTVFTNTAEAYRRLSPEFQARLHGLKAEHSDVGLIEKTKKEKGRWCGQEGRFDGGAPDRQDASCYGGEGTVCESHL